MSEQIGFEEAFEHIVDALRAVTRSTGGMRPGALRGCDLWLPNLVPQVAQQRGEFISLSPGPYDPKTEAWLIPFYDAAAELCRIGVLRRGEITPMGMSVQKTSGDGYSLTTFGLGWVKSRHESIPRDPSRFMAVLYPFRNRFGQGFVQRSSEAIGCYRTGFYLASCVMCGAAAESILLSLALAKIKDEAAVLSNYRRAKGRKQLTDAIVGKLKGGIRNQLETYVQLIGFWRDEAGHGQHSDITEPQANLSLLQLLRFAQFANDEWDILTA